MCNLLVNCTIISVNFLFIVFLYFPFFIIFSGFGEMRGASCYTLCSARRCIFLVNTVWVIPWKKKVNLSLEVNCFALYKVVKTDNILNFFCPLLPQLPLGPKILMLVPPLVNFCGFLFQLQVSQLALPRSIATSLRHHYIPQWRLVNAYQDYY